MRTVEGRIADVRRVVEAARQLVAEREAIGPAIVASTGLSAAGVERALTRHLEIDPTDEELGRLVSGAGDAARVVVILSANVFVGALRAIALARAAAPNVVVRPSRRDAAFARALVRRIGDPAIVLAEEVVIEDVREGEIHVYGHDTTIAAVRARAPVPVRGHGSGMGVAFVDAASALDVAADAGEGSSSVLDDAARALASDVIAFDQRGCLSPRVVIVKSDLADAFAEALHAALVALDGAVPRGELPAEVRAESERYIATMTYAGRALVGAGHAIGIAPPGAPLVASPAYRHVHLVPCSTDDEAEVLLAPVKRAITAVGIHGERPAWIPPWARVSGLGRMQRPPLDGPVDLRTA